ncbi:MAG: glycosyltransferase family 2 protein [Thermoplasmatota archaeon]|nr:glycosyltransferase family 2 protein [Halobacteriales archaeon]
MTQPAARKGLVTIVVPAKNEEAAIARTLASLPLQTLHLEGYRSEVVVLDGASRDATPRIAESMGARVLPDATPGKGNALRNARRHFAGDYVVMLDADGTYAPDAIPRVLGPISFGDADVVMGSRVAQPGAMTAVHKVGNRLLSLSAATLYGRWCTDLCTGLWGFRASALHAMPLKSERFGLEAEFFALAARLRMRVASVPVDYLPRQGTSNLRAVRDGLRILRRLMVSRVARMPAAPEAEPVPDAGVA